MALSGGVLDHTTGARCAGFGVIVRRSWCTCVAVALAIGIAMAPSVPAPPACNGNTFELEVPYSDRPLYIDDRGGNGIWFYLEDNDRDGLQSGGSLLFVTDTCRQGNDPDRLVATFPLGS